MTQSLMYTQAAARVGVDKYAAMSLLVPMLFSLSPLPGSGTEYTDSIRASFSGMIRAGIMGRHVEHIPHSVIVSVNGAGLICTQQGRASVIQSDLPNLQLSIKASHQSMESHSNYEYQYDRLWSKGLRVTQQWILK